MTRRIVTLILILGLILAACASGSKKKAAQGTQAPLTTIRLPMGYIPSVQYAPFYVAVQKGYFKAEGLDIQFDYSAETDGVALVGANQLPFALVSGEQVPLARAQGLPVVYVLGWWQDYPVAIVSMKTANLQKPADLKGKKIGLPGLYGANYVGLRALLNAGGLKESDVTLDSIGYNQVEALVGGREDAVVVYVNNEPIQLRAKGYDINVMRVADYVHLASNGIISNETTIAQNPALVQRMVQATLRGVKDTIDQPDDAYEICKNFIEGLSQADQKAQKEILTTSIEFWKAQVLGYSQPDAWTNMQDVLLEMSMLKQPLDMNKAFTNAFVQAK